MLASRRHFFIVGLEVLLLVPSFCWGLQPEEKNVGRLKRDVAERERQLLRAQRDVAEARARLALAEGKRDAAIAELRKAVACHQGEVQWIRDHANLFCDPREPMTAAQWDSARARA